MIYLKLLFTALFWAGTFIAGRMLAGQVPPLAAAVSRFAIASVVLLAVVYWRDRRLPQWPRQSRLPVVFLGLTGVVAYNLFFFWGLKNIPAARAAVIIASNPVLVALGATLLFGHRLDRINATGICLSVSGAIIAISNGNPFGMFSGGLTWGDLLIFGCVISWSAFSLIGKIVLNRMPALAAITYAAVAGTLMLAVAAIVTGLSFHPGQYTFNAWGCLAYLGIFGTALGFVWYYEGIEKLGPARAALFINFVPVFAMVIAYLLLAEPVGWSLVVGTAMVITGVYLTNNGLILPWKVRTSPR